MKNDFYSRAIGVNTDASHLQGQEWQEPVELFRCNSCHTVHEDEDEALGCCPRELGRLWRCGACNAQHPTRDSALRCCDAQGLTQPTTCPVCLREHASHADAADCCLHLHPELQPWDRRKLADLVKAGTPWREAMELVLSKRPAESLQSPDPQTARTAQLDLGGSHEKLDADARKPH